ncbi:MAG: prenyltransferase [Desulfovibrionaceae bacterium]|nr:prenyltransferase [Desulfovibrionaceae bacterium]
MHPFFPIIRSACQGKKADGPRHSARETAAAWWRAGRPAFFITDFIPVGLAFVLAYRFLGYWPWTLCGIMLFCCFCLHTVANLADELFDYLQGVDREDTIGGTHVIQGNYISPRELLAAIILLILGAGISAVWLIMQCGQPILFLILLFSIASAVFYVAPPLCYGYHGFGELSAGINMGCIMVCASYMIMTGSFSASCLSASVPVGMMVAGIVYYQNLPEIETDPASGKHTLPSIIGKKNAVLLFRIWWPAVWLWMSLLWICGITGPIVLLWILTIPLYLTACRHLRNVREWLELDDYGYIVRRLYLFNGIILVLSAFFQE